MTNNDIIRRLRYTFELTDSDMITLFKSGGYDATRAEISDWLKKDDHEDYQQLFDKELSTFLNGFINKKRGKKEGEQPVPEKRLNNNIILRKLKIALALNDTDILEILELVNMQISKHELSALFRNPKQTQYRKCREQLLRNFLHGLQIKYHDYKM